MTLLRLLRLFLTFAAFTWGISVFGVLLPWSTVTSVLTELGANKLPNDVMLDYWFRMTSGAFFLIGCLFAAAAIAPQRYAAIIPLLGMLMLVEGTILLIHGFRLHLPLLPFYADAIACLLGGAGILKFSRAVVS